MRRSIWAVCTIWTVLLACCGSSPHATGVTPTDAQAFATAHAVCQQFSDADAARNADPQRMTDDQADLVFANLTDQLSDAAARDPKAWSQLRTVATRLKTELTSGTASDHEIETAITKVADACTLARKRPAHLVAVTTSPPTSEPATSTSISAAR